VIDVQHSLETECERRRFHRAPALAFAPDRLAPRDRTCSAGNPRARARPHGFPAAARRRNPLGSKNSRAPPRTSRGPPPRPPRARLRAWARPSPSPSRAARPRGRRASARSRRPARATAPRRPPVPAHQQQRLPPRPARRRPARSTRAGPSPQASRAAAQTTPRGASSTISVITRASSRWPCAAG
jgi:hypothetical protein